MIYANSTEIMAYEVFYCLNCKEKYRMNENGKVDNCPNCGNNSYEYEYNNPDNYGN